MIVWLVYIFYSPIILICFFLREKMKLIKGNTLGCSNPITKT